MRITVGNLRKIIREEIAQDAEKLVGKYLWPAERGLKVGEPNTKYEDSLLNALLNSISFNQDPLTSKQVQDLFFLANTGKYSDVLVKKKRGKVYRGVNVTREWFSSSFGVNILDVIKSEPKKVGSGRLENFFFRIPDSAAQGTVWGKEGVPSSWTTDLSVTPEFASGMAGRGVGSASVKLVLEADCSRGDFLDYKPFYGLTQTGRIGSHKERAGEEEILALGEVVLSGAFLVFNKYELEKLSAKEDWYTYKDPETNQLKSFQGTPEEVSEFMDKNFVKQWGKKFDPLTRRK